MEIGTQFGLHPLALEDVVHAHQRAKVESYDEYLFIVLRAPQASHGERFELEQIAIFLGERYVISFQQRPGDSYDPVRERLRASRGRIREMGADYLVYALIDASIDAYFPVVDRFADKLDVLEDDITDTSGDETVEQIHEYRNELLLLRRSIRPLREALNALVRDPHALIGDDTRVFLRDCYDHAIQLFDLLDVYREMCAGLRDYQLSIASNRMNEIMKVLTLIATIFMPLSFLAGIYGMNFNTAEPGNMPELNMPYGYLGLWTVMAAVTGAMLTFFRRRGWLGRRRTRR